MRIAPSYYYPVNFYQPNRNKITFCSTSRFYKTETGQEIGNNTWLYRNDIDWQALAEFEIENFKYKDKVNIIEFAASDGSEGYTQIISLLENKRRADVSKFFPITAYDINKFIVKKAADGDISLSQDDMDRLRKNSVDFSKYFIRNNSTYLNRPEYQKLLQKHPDTIIGPMDSFKVKPVLTDKITFNHGDIFDILPQIKDEGNTIILCRNMFSYIDDKKVQEFIQTASKTLKQGSLLIIGDHDNYFRNMSKYLNDAHFIKMQKNVYLKI